MLDDPRTDVANAIAQLRRRLGLARVERWCVRGLGAGALAVAITLALGQLGLPSIGLAAGVAVLAAGMLAGAIVGLILWPSRFDAARLADVHFRLNDRLTTALEFHASDEPLLALQRQEAAGHLGSLRITQSLRGQIGRRDPALAGAAFAVLLALTLFGGGTSPSASAFSATATDRSRINHAATRAVPSLIRRLEQGLTAQQRANPAFQNLQNTLTQLRQQLLRSPDRAAALLAISAAEQRIRQNLASPRPLNAAALMHALSSFTTPAERALASEPGSAAASAAAHALSRLAPGLKRLSSSQRAALSHALSRAQRTSTNKQYQAALRRAASALSQGKTESAAKALNQAAQSLANAATAQTEHSRLTQATNNLDALKNTVSGMASDTAAQSSGSHGAGQKGHSSNGNQKTASQATGRPNGLGHARTKRPGGSGSATSGNGVKRTNQRGLDLAVIGHAPTTSSGLSPNAKGGGGAGEAAGTNPGGSSSQFRYVTVFVPGKIGAGASISVQERGAGNSGGRLVPYRLVIASYSHTAHVALDRVALPPSLQAYVRQYFSSVSR